MDVKAFVKKLSKSNKDLSDERLRRKRRSCVGLQLFALVAALVMALAYIGFNGSAVSETLHVALSAIFLSAVGFSMAVYAQFRVDEAEVNFELRLREAIAAYTKTAAD